MKMCSVLMMATAESFDSTQPLFLTTFINAPWKREKLLFHTFVETPLRSAGPNILLNNARSLIPCRAGRS